ncbi:DUF6310 domain-containing protein [Citreicoccus inhibens]|uniref:DUF6310 domain-containing protein n=1 Tax=Citreicoccus inhibens TaxID=2849499 RepID=UPI002E2DFD68|nr:DUF6310 domain-containing protein [Citreicoccus inhibens]
MLAERCFHTLDHDRVRFNDPTRRCAVASAEAAAPGFGLCVFAAPELIAGAVIVVGVVVIGVAIQEALDAHALRAGTTAETAAAPQRLSARQATSPGQTPKPKPSGQDWLPPVPTEPRERERLPECTPVPVPHAGNDASHNACADTFPPNRYPGMDVLVNGIRFDALQVGALALWEIKTHRFDTYNDFVRDHEIENELRQLHEELNAATACGYDFVVGVSTEEHKRALLDRDPELRVVATRCPR